MSIFHRFVFILFLCHQNSSRKRQPEEESEDEEESSEKATTSVHYFEVDKLIKFKVVRGKEMVLVHWKGYTSADDSWEPVENMNIGLRNDVAELREQYQRTTGKNKNKRKK